MCIRDRVSEVLSIPAAAVAPPPQLQRHQSRYVRGLGRVGEAVKILLDLDALLLQEEGAGVAAPV
jgi:purine-binding chemotaxis protein CheW